MSCQRKSRTPKAASLGHDADHARRRALGAGATGTSRASSPASSRSRLSELSVLGLVVGMPAHLLSQALGDLAGHGGHLGRLEAAGTFEVDRELGDDATGAAREHE